IAPYEHQQQCTRILQGLKYVPIDERTALVVIKPQHLGTVCWIRRVLELNRALPRDDRDRWPLSHFGDVGPRFVKLLPLGQTGVFNNLRDAQLVIFEDAASSIVLVVSTSRFLSLMVAGVRAPTDNGLFVSPRRHRQQPPVSLQALVPNVVNESF